MNKECKIIILPTQSGSRICTRNKDNKLLFDKDYWNTPLVNNYHLYIISDDKFKEGDWVYDPAFNRISKFKHKLTLPDGNCSDHCKAIIATSDYNLYLNGGIDNFDPLPQISNEFLEKYVELSGIINKVEVEYIQIPNFERHIGIVEPYQYVLKINSNNTINIRISPTSNEWF